MVDSDIKPLITPTMTIKAEFIDEFKDIDEDSEEFQIAKINIGPKFNKLPSSKVIKYNHLNN